MDFDEWVEAKGYELTEENEQDLMSKYITEMEHKGELQSERSTTY